MIVTFYLEDMSSKVIGQFFVNIHDFARTKFVIKVSDEGILTIDGSKHTISYKIGDDPKTSYTKGEAIKNYVNSAEFRKFVKSRFWTVYKTEKII